MLTGSVEGLGGPDGSFLRDPSGLEVWLQVSLSSVSLWVLHGITPCPSFPPAGWNTHEGL